MQTIAVILAYAFAMACYWLATTIAPHMTWPHSAMEYDALAHPS